MIVPLCFLRSLDHRNELFLVCCFVSCGVLLLVVSICLLVYWYAWLLRSASRRRVVHKRRRPEATKERTEEFLCAVALSGKQV